MWDIGDRFKIVPKSSHLSNDNNAITITRESEADGAQATVSRYTGLDRQRFTLLEASTTAGRNTSACTPLKHAKPTIRLISTVGNQNALEKAVRGSSPAMIYGLSGRRVSAETAGRNGAQGAFYIVKVLK